MTNAVKFTVNLTLDNINRVSHVRKILGLIKSLSLDLFLRPPCCDAVGNVGLKIRSFHK